MKFLSIYILLSAAISASHAHTTSDSFPSCIAAMKAKDSNIIIKQYDYKGQRWFGITRKNIDPKVSDPMNNIIFYNTKCERTATWQRGGIAALSRLIPDSIDKTKLFRTDNPKIHEAILQLALKNNATAVTEYTYLGQTLYFLNIDNFNSKKMVIEEPYYDSNGVAVITFHRATQGAFMRAQRWEPAGKVQPEKLMKRGIVWSRW